MNLREEIAAALLGPGGRELVERKALDQANIALSVMVKWLREHSASKQGWFINRLEAEDVTPQDLADELEAMP